MKPFALLACLMFVGCAADTTKIDYSLEFRPPSEFDWMPNPLQWEHNVMNCRSLPQCNPADLFYRT
jgi:hypothetical protein